MESSPMLNGGDRDSSAREFEQIIGNSPALERVRDAAGRIPRRYNLLTDIDERKKAEAKLQDENVALREEIAKASMFEEIVGTSLPLQTVVSRTERTQADEALRRAQSDLARVNRVTTMGELAASLAHEVNQPIAAAVANANACLRWLGRDRPDLEEARAAAARIIENGRFAGDIIRRIRSQFEKGTLRPEVADVNEIIRETIALLRSEAMRHNILVRTELAAGLPLIMGDRVQLQQVTMNLIVNSIDAMKEVDGTRELSIKSQRAEHELLQVSVSDTGMGLPPQQEDQIFDAFFTTKPHGTGMGLRISRSIIESHGGRLWAADNSPRGATFQFTLPATVMPASGSRDNDTEVSSLNVTTVEMG